MRWRRRRSREQELERELHSHLELEAEEQRDAGLSAEEAGYAARRAFGNTTLVKQDVRAESGWRWLESIWSDLRYAARVLRKNSGFTVVIATTLALGIGANTAIFSVCDAVLLKPLPYTDPKSILMLWEKELSDGAMGPVAPANFVDWRDQSHSFDEIAAIDPFPDFILTGRGEPERLTGA